MSSGDFLPFVVRCCSASKLFCGVRRQPTLNDGSLPRLLAGGHVVLEFLGSKEAEDS